MQVNVPRRQKDSGKERTAGGSEAKEEMGRKDGMQCCKGSQQRED